MHGTYANAYKYEISFLFENNTRLALFIMQSLGMQSYVQLRRI